MINEISEGDVQKFGGLEVVTCCYNSNSLYAAPFDRQMIAHLTTEKYTELCIEKHQKFSEKILKNYRRRFRKSIDKRI